MLNETGHNMAKHCLILEFLISKVDINYGTKSENFEIHRFI